MCLPKKTLYMGAKAPLDQKFLNMNVYFKLGLSYLKKTIYIMTDSFFGEI